MAKCKDLSGQKFNRLLVTRRVDNQGRYVSFECECECGNIKIIRATDIKSGAIKSCGCLQKELARKNKNSHWSLPIGEASRNALINSYKYGATRRGISFELTKDECEKLFKGDCVYCGSKPNSVIRQKAANGEYIYNGIDRVDNNIGYRMNNCVSCCKQCNYSKRELSERDFLDWINKVYMHQFNENGRAGNGRIC